MYNSFLFNTTLYWSLWTSSWWGWWWDVSFKVIAFNNYDFSDIIISNIPDDYEWIRLDVQSYELSSHGQGLWNRLIKNKTIQIEGRIVAENAVSLEAKINKIKSKLLQWESLLYVKRAEWILQTKAIVTGISIPRETRTVNTISISVTFTILDPFMYSLEKHELAYYWISWNFYTSIFYETWSHEANPVIFIMFWNWTNANNLQVTIWQKKVQINWTQTSWDIISLDWEKVDVAKNWSYWIDWVWEFGELDFWENPIEIKVTGTANYSVFIQYRDTYV